MGTIVTANQPCLDTTNCGSSDALQIYEDGGSHCFSCGGSFSPAKTAGQEVVVKSRSKGSSTTVEEIKGFTSRGFADRKIKKNVCEFFEVKVSYNADGDIDAHYYPYSGGGYKVRKLPKTFSFIGPYGGVFGKDKFTGGGKRLVIVEGEVDALSVAEATFQKYKKFYPVISIPSAAGTKEILEIREWVRSFQEVVLCLDNDKAGEEATQKLIKIIGIDKVKLWKPLDCKDANEVLVKYGGEKLYQYIWDAEAYSPAGIIRKEAIWKQIVERRLVPSVPYPPCLEGINSKIKGMRLGEIVLLISGTGAGKSSIAREIVIHLIETTTDDVGVISLEESPGETGTKLAGMAIHKNPENEEIPDEELKVGFDRLFGEDRIVVLDHQGAVKDESIVSQLEYMCLSGCKYLLIDHITILVSEGSEGLTGNEAIDKIMNDLLRLVKRHNVCIILISHLRKVMTGSKPFEEGRMPTLDDIRGSGSIKQVCFDIIAFTRNSQAENEIERNTIKMSVLKARTVGKTGKVPGATYNNSTSRLTAVGGEAFEDVTEKTRKPSTGASTSMALIQEVQMTPEMIKANEELF